MSKKLLYYEYIPKDEKYDETEANMTHEILKHHATKYGIKTEDCSNDEFKILSLVGTFPQLAKFYMSDPLDKSTIHKIFTLIKLLGL